MYMENGGVLKLYRGEFGYSHAVFSLKESEYMERVVLEKLRRKSYHACLRQSCC